MFFFFGGSNRKVTAALGGVIGAVAICASAQAGITTQVIGGGWQASWDSALDPYVDINSDGVSGNAVYFEKIATFTAGPNSGGIFPAIPIVFSIVPGYTGTIVENLVITDEVITNQTGYDWGGFRMDVLDHGEVVFDPAATAASGGPPPIGFNIGPFTTAAFSDGNTRLDMGGGVFANGTTQNLGRGLGSGGELWIHVNNVSVNTVFVLKETPTPAPGAVALLGLAAAFGSRRRRA